MKTTTNITIEQLTMSPMVTNMMSCNKTKTIW